MRWFSVWLILIAGTAAAQNCEIVMPDHRMLKADRIEVRGDGNLEYVSPDSKVSVMIPKGRYLFVRSPKPQEALNGDQHFRKKEYAEAEKQYLLAYGKARLLGWELYTVRKRAECLLEQKKTADALNLLTGTLAKYRLQDPEQEQEYLQTVNLWIALQIQTKQVRPGAEKLLIRLRSSSNPELILSGIVKQGDLAFLRENYKEAARCYGEALLLFPETPERKEILTKCRDALKQRNAPETENYNRLLKQEFPGDNFTFRLK